MTVYTVFAPGAWWEDIRPAMEDWQGGQDSGDLSPGEVEVVEQFWDEARTVKRGGGSAHRFDLTSRNALMFLLCEAEYRRRFNADLLSFNEVTEPEERAHARKCQRAAEVLLARCQAALEVDAA